MEGLAGAIRFTRDFGRYAGARGVWAALLVFLGAIFEGGGLLFVIPVLGIVIGSGAAQGRFERAAVALLKTMGITDRLQSLGAVLAILALLMLLRTLIVTRRDVLLATLQLGFVEETRARVAECLARSSWQTLVSLRHARVTHLMSGDIQRIGTAAHFLLQSETALVMLAIQCALAFWLAPLLSLIAFALLAISAFAMMPVLRRAHALGAFVTNANLELLDSTAQFLGGLKLAIAQDLQAEFLCEFRRTLSALSGRQIANLRQQSESRAVITALTAIVGASLVWVGYGLFHLPAPLLITFLLIVARMSGPVGQLQQGAQQLAHTLPAYESTKLLEAELTRNAEILSIASRAIQFDTNGTIEFSGVGYRHAKDGGGLCELSMWIRPGEFLGITGPSGSGKTTFADLLVGLIAPQTGVIKVGGAVLEGETRQAWRRHIGYVAQDPFLFYDTVRQNLLWASASATDADMWQILEAVGVKDVVERLGGLAAMLGERGVHVSGGERQRLALARALLRAPALLVLDEATSALDVPSETAILARIRDALPGSTIVMIAHRAESLSRCDRVLQIVQGRLASVSPAIELIR